jgi:mRNA interferase YafQ
MIFVRAIERSTQFKRDYKRESKGPYRSSLDADLIAILRMMAADELLPVRYRDHALTGQWRDCRDCHIRPDLVLIYQKVGTDTLRLVRLGSHSELGL